jgi:hypothetical protein
MCVYAYVCRYVSVSVCGGQRSISGVFLYPFSALVFFKLSLELTLLVASRSAYLCSSSDYRYRLPQPALPWAVESHAASCFPCKDFTHQACLPSAGTGWLDLESSYHTSFTHTENPVFLLLEWKMGSELVYVETSCPYIAH